MRIIFAGTPTAAVPTLAALAESQHDVVAVITRPPARQGRGKKLYPSPVAEKANELGVPVIETSNPGEERTLREIARLSPQLGVIVAYGAILSPAVLEIPTNGWINLHFSDLPRWRGAAPVQHAIWARDPQTATCVFQLEKGLDTGPIFSQEIVPLTGKETTDRLLADLSTIGANQVLTVVNEIEAGTARATPQDEGPDKSHVTVASRLTKPDTFVSFTGNSLEVDAQVRAATGNPGAWTRIEGEQILRIGPVIPFPEQPTPGVGRIIASKNRVVVGCAKGIVELKQVGPAGKKWMNAADWWRGAHLDTGAWLGGDRD